MKNKAKCALCNSTIESFHTTDYVECKCGEISVDGGMSLRCASKNWKNFLRIDDLGKEFSVTAQEVAYKKVDQKKQEQGPISKKDVLDQVKTMIASIEGLPQGAMSTSLTHYDMLSVLYLLLASLSFEDGL